MTFRNCLALIYLLFTAQTGFSGESLLANIQTPEPKESHARQALDRPWSDWERYFDSRPWLEIYRLQENMSSESAIDLQLQGWDHFLQSLKDYCERRLRRSRSELKVKAPLILNPGTKKAFFHKPVYEHKGLGRKLTWSEMYSLVKHGEGEAAGHFARLIADSVPESSRKEISANPGNWAIATPAGHAGEPHEAKKASFVLSSKVAEILGIDVIPMHLSFTQKFYYCTLEDALSRFAMALRQYAPVKTSKKHILIRSFHEYGRSPCRVGPL